MFFWSRKAAIGVERLAKPGTVLANGITPHPHERLAITQGASMGARSLPHDFGCSGAA
jgi:hypothetical protein